MELKEKLAIKDRLLAAACKKARDDFRAYVQLIAPLILPEGFSQGAHIDLLCKEVQSIVDNRDGRLQIWISPRSMKSKLCNVLLGSWVRGRFPFWDIIVVSNSSPNAEAFSKEVMSIVELAEFRMIFPECVIKEDERRSKEWVTTAGGKYLAAGTETKLAGRGAHLAIIDDPLSEQEAYSAAERKRVQVWYPGGLRTRLAPGGRIILINTRWHEDDLSGFLLQKADEDEETDQWRVVSIPAILDEESAEILGKQVGESYWPERWPLESLLKTKKNLPANQWSALYMQDPTSDEAGIINPEDFNIWSGSKPPNCEYILFSLDTAYSAKTTADYSVIQTWGIFNMIGEDEKGNEIMIPQMILLGNMRDKLAFPELEQRLLKMIEIKKPDLIIVEKKSSGQAIIPILQRRGLPVLEYTPDRDKISRAHSVVPLLWAGRVWLPGNKDWAADLLEECHKFPYGKHDDQVDAMVQAAIYLRDSWKISHYTPPPERGRKKKAKTYWSSLTTA